MQHIVSLPNEPKRGVSIRYLTKKSLACLNHLRFRHARHKAEACDAGARVTRRAPSLPCEACAASVLKRTHTQLKLSVSLSLPLARSAVSPHLAVAGSAPSRCPSFVGRHLAATSTMPHASIFPCSPSATPYAVLFCLAGLLCPLTVRPCAITLPDVASRQPSPPYRWF